MTLGAPSSTIPGPLEPFGQVDFAVLWITTVASTIATWMQDVGAAWLTTELAPSPLFVASVQASTTLPMFLFALLAGVVADIVDRWRLLVAVNIALAAAAAVLAALTAAGKLTPTLLLAWARRTARYS